VIISEIRVWEYFTGNGFHYKVLLHTRQTDDKPEKKKEQNKIIKIGF
jgi:hypothetical protein